MSKYKIALILPYFGKFPEWFELWIASAGENSSIDWLLFTDDHTSFGYSSNIHVKYMKWEEMKNLIRSKFDFEVSIETPYKLCDYKPAFGDIFKEYLEDYDFWGHCDPDCIWGNIRAFVTDDILNRYQKIFMRGHLTLYKNELKVNQWYKTLSEVRYKEVYSSAESFSYDEGDPIDRPENINGLLQKNNIDYYQEMCFDDIYQEKLYFVSRYARDNYIKVTGCEELNNLKYILRYSCGKLYQVMLIGGKIFQFETCYAHFQKRKMKICLTDLDSSSYLIIPNKFVASVPIDERFIKRNCVHFPVYFHHLWVRYGNLKRKIVKVLN